MLPYKFISESRVGELLEWAPVVDAVEHALKSVSTGCAFQSPRVKIVLPESNLLYSTPGYLKDDKYGALASRVMTKFPSNRRLQPPRSALNANISLMDESTGVVKAIIQGNELTDWRTAAVSVAATKHLHKEKPKEILAIIGAGIQGRIHAIAFQTCFKFREVRIWNRTGKRAVDLARKLNHELKTDAFVSCETVSDCVKNADVIVTAAMAKEMLVKHEMVKKGAHINAISVNPSGTDLDEETYRISKVFCDHWTGVEHELQHIIAFGAKFVGQVGDVIAGSVQAPGAGETSIFQSLGMAVEDCALARLIYDLDQIVK
uniref:Ketimine reductase mu-crystallin n=1 Tax=Photinus pyralis TaxID=7054 RepID=A0A1Y1NL51_PHOPY